MTPRGGLFAGVGGASGVGKDTLLDGARRKLAGNAAIVFARRVITRPPDAGGEDHQSFTPAEFASMEAQGAFCLSWQAHGLSYGVPVSVLQDIDEGRTVVCNISRAAAPAAQHAFARLALVEITAQPATIAGRLAARGRETAHDIETRLARSVDGWADGLTVHRIANDADPAIAINEFVALLLSLSGQTAGSA